MKGSFSQLKPLELGNSSLLKVGDTIIAVGNPFGLSGSLTTGVVSQTGRSLRTQTTPSYVIPNVIQIDAAINPGNSGGPLLNYKGEVVGITTAILSETGSFSGVGFAIPSNTIKREIQSLIQTGSYQHPWLGVQGADMTKEIAEAMKVNVSRGWLIIDVVQGGPAEKGGLRGGTTPTRIGGRPLQIGGDIIVRINDREIRNGDDLSVFLEENTKPGQVINLTIIRGNVKVQTPVTLEARLPPSS